jgi:hypothetical protein
MKREMQSTIKAFYRKEVERIIVPPLPQCLKEPAEASAPATSTFTGSGSAPHDFRRRLASELVRIALTAAIVSAGIALPQNHSTNPVSQGIDRLFTDSGLQDSVSRNLLDAALMIGKSIVKE